MSIFDKSKKKRPKIIPTPVLSAPLSDVRPIGVYSVPDCYLFEMEIDHRPSKVDLMEVVLTNIRPITGDDQAPFEEKYLSDDGTEVIGDMYKKPDDKEDEDYTRVCFFMFCYDIKNLLEAPSFGFYMKSEVSEMPERLKKIITFDKNFVD